MTTPKPNQSYSSRMYGHTLPVEPLTLAIRRELAERGLRVSVSLQEYYTPIVRNMILELQAKITSNSRTVESHIDVPRTWWDGLLAAAGLRKWAKFRRIETKVVEYRACPHMLDGCERPAHVMWLGGVGLGDRVGGGGGLCGD